MMRRVFSTVRGATISPWAQAPSLAQVMNPAGRKIEAAGAECETINLSLDEASGVATVELNRPDKVNAANMRMWWELQHAFRAIDTDERCRAALLVGSGKFFCSGMDLSVFAQMDAAMTAEPCEARAREGLAHLIDFLQDACSAAERCRVPVIAAIDGPCIGGGLDIATACDLRLCSERAVFSAVQRVVAARCTGAALLSPDEHGSGGLTEVGGPAHGRRQRRASRQAAARASSLGRSQRSPAADSSPGTEPSPVCSPPPATVPLPAVALPAAPAPAAWPKLVARIAGGASDWVAGHPAFQW